MKRKIKKSVNTLFRLIGILLIAVFLLSILWPTYYIQFRVTTTPQMLLYKSTPEKKEKGFKVEYEWTPLDSISRNVIVAVLAAEDNNFYIHDGFSPIQENDSTQSVIPKRHETISQKTAHNVFLTKGDSWSKNILEPYFTMLEEYLWGKDRILEIYLNTALFGNGIFGIEAASQIYFGKTAGELTQDEAATLASFLESPETIDIHNPSIEILAKQKKILLDMGLMIHIKVGKNPIDEKETPSKKHIRRKQWQG